MADKSFDILDVMLAKALIGKSADSAAARANAAAELAEQAASDASAVADKALAAYVVEKKTGTTSLIVTDGSDGAPVESLKVTFDLEEEISTITVVYNGRQIAVPFTSGGGDISTDHGTLDVVGGTLTVDGQTYELDNGGEDLVTVKGENIITAPTGMTIEFNYRADIEAYLKENYMSLIDLDNATVGNAKQLIATVGFEDNAPYLFRTSGGTADIGDRETDELVGGTIAWNQLVKNGNFADSSQWTPQNCTMAVANNTATVTPSSATCRLSTGIPIVKGHKYLRSMKVQGDEGIASLSWYGAVLKDVALDGTEKVCTDVIENTSDSSNWVFQVMVRNNKNLAEVKFKEVVCIDLTQMFGSTIADYIYTLESATAGSGIAWLRKYGFFTKPYYPYNAGGLLSVKTSAHKMVGFNAFKGNSTDSTQYVDHSYITSNGSVSANNSYNRFRIKAVPSNKYCLSVSSGTLVSIANIRYVDADYNFINYSDIGSSQIKKTFTTPSNCRYVEFALATNESRNVCFNLSWDEERDGEYAPYVEYNYPLDNDLELRGIPKLDSNNALYYDGDTYASDGSVTRKYGIVDLGTLDWTRGMHNDIAVFYTSLPQLQGSYSIISNGYKSVGYLGGITDDKQYILKFQYFGANMFGIRDDVYTDAATFKTAMSGVMLVYELATPTTETATPYTNPQIVDDNGTEEYVDEREVPIPVGHVTHYQANLRAKLEMAPNSPDGDGDYIVRQTNGKNEYVPLPVSGVYQHNAVIELYDSDQVDRMGYAYMSYVSKLATPFNIVDIGNTYGAPKYNVTYPATGYANTTPIVAITFDSTPNVTLTRVDGTTVTGTMTELVDTIG